MEFMTHLFRFFIFFVSSFFSSDFMIFFSSSDFTDESEGIPAEAITHGFSQIFGLWPMACARYVLLLFFVTQISQMTQIFLCGRVWSHRFHRYTQIFLCGDYFVPQISQIFTDFFYGILVYSQGVSAPTGQVASVKIRE